MQSLVEIPLLRIADEVAGTGRRFPSDLAIPQSLLLRADEVIQ